MRLRAATTTSEDQPLSDEEAVAYLASGGEAAEPIRYDWQPKESEDLDRPLSDEEATAYIKGTVPEQPSALETIAGRALEIGGALSDLPGIVGNYMQDTRPGMGGVGSRGGPLAGAPYEPPDPNAPGYGGSALGAGFRGAAQLVYPEESRGRGGIGEQFASTGTQSAAAALAGLVNPALAPVVFFAQEGVPAYYDTLQKTGNREKAVTALMGTGTVAQLENLGFGGQAARVVQKLAKVDQVTGGAVAKAAIGMTMGAAKGAVKEEATEILQTGLSDEILQYLNGEDIDTLGHIAQVLQDPTIPVLGGLGGFAEALVDRAHAKSAGIGDARPGVVSPGGQQGSPAAPTPASASVPAITSTATAAETGPATPAAPTEGAEKLGRPSMVEDLGEEGGARGADFLGEAPTTEEAPPEAPAAPPATGAKPAETPLVYAHTQDLDPKAVFPEGAKVGPVETRPIASLRRRQNERMRNPISEEVVADFQRKFDAGEPVDPVVLLRKPNGEEEVLEGHNRIAAAEAMGFEDVPVRVVDLQAAPESKAAAAPVEAPAPQTSQEAPGGATSPQGSQEAPGAKQAEQAPEQLFGGVPPLPGKLGVSAGQAAAWVKKQLGFRGHAMAVIQRAAEKSRGYQDAEGRETRFRWKDIAKAARKAIGKNWQDTHGEAINAAIKDPSKIPSLPEGVRRPVIEMRAHIDRMSGILKDLPGAVSEETKKVIESHEGEYVTRAYRAHIDKRWKDRVPDAVRKKLLDLWTSWAAPLDPAAKKALETQAREKPQEAKDAMKRRRDIRKEVEGLRAASKSADPAVSGPAKQKIKDLFKERRGLSRTARRMTEAATEARGELRGRKQFAGKTKEQIEGQMNASLEEAREGVLDETMAAASKVGKKNLSILKHRKIMPPEFRDFLGEIKSPIANYANSVMKLARMIAQHKVYDEIAAAGNGEWLFDEATGEFDAYLGDSPTLGALAKKYTTRDIKAALTAITPKETNAFLKAVLATNYTMKWLKIVENPINIMRQVWGNPLHMVRNGHGGALLSPTMWKKAVLPTLEEAKRLDRLGVTGQSVSGDEMRQLRDAQRKMPGDDQGPYAGAKAVFETTRKVSEDIYQAPDEIQRRLGFYAEEKYRLSLGKSADVAAEEAAEFVNKHYPTFSRITPFLKHWRRQFVLGNYYAFISEQFRNTGNLMVTIHSELKSKDPRVRNRAIARGAGWIASKALLPGTATAINMMNGIDEDEDKNRRAFVPPWDRDSNIIWLGDKKKGRYIDLSDTDPASIMTDPIVRILKGDSPGEAIEAWYNNLASTYGIPIESKGGRLSPSVEGLSPVANLGAEIVSIIANGHTLSGKRVENLTQFIIDEAQPALTQQLRRGAEKGWLKESAALFTGHQPDFDVEKSVAKEAYLFRNRISDLTATMAPKDKKTDKRSKARQKELETERKILFKEFSDKVKSAKALGVDGYKLQALFEDPLSDEVADALIGGYYLPYEFEE